MLKIAILIKRFAKSGGKEIYALEVARRLSQKGHQIDIFSYIADPGLLDGMTFHKIPGRLTFSNILSTYNFIHQTNKLLKNSAYDIIHSHERNYNQDVLTLHSFSYLSGLEKYKGLRKFEQKYLSPRSLGYLWLEKKQMTSPWLISVSKAISRDVSSRYNRNEKMVVIWPGVDTELFNPDFIRRNREKFRRRLGALKNEIVIVFVGSAFKRKGLDRLIPAISEKMRLLVVGTGEYLNRYKQMVRRHGLEGRVTFFGFDEDVKQYYTAADVVVLPSKSEAFGMSILEAMACGLPTIVSSNSGVADIIEHGRNGYLMHDAKELPELLKNLLCEEIRSSVGKEARMTAEQYTWEKIATAHEACYRKILSEKSRS